MQKLIKPKKKKKKKEPQCVLPHLRSLLINYLMSFSFTVKYIPSRSSNLMLNAFKLYIFDVDNHLNYVK